MTILGVDYAWNHPAPQDIFNAGYRFVIRYLSLDPTKNLTIQEAQALHSAGLAILLYWENGTLDTLGGATVGASQSSTANHQADALSYPTQCPIFYAVDFNASGTQFVPIAQYFNAVGGRGKGCYGSWLTVETITAAFYIQASAWSGSQDSPRANIYQRQSPTLHIPNTNGGYDELVLQGHVPMWGKAGVVDLLNPDPPPTPTPTPTPTPINPSQGDKDMLVLMDAGEPGLFIFGDKAVGIPNMAITNALIKGGVGVADISNIEGGPEFYAAVKAAGSA